MHYVTTDEAGRIAAATDGTVAVVEEVEVERVDPETGEAYADVEYVEREERCHCGEGEFEFEFPPDFDFSRLDDWLIVDGELVRDPLPDPPPSPVQELRADRDGQMDALAELGALSADASAAVADLMAAVAELGAMVAGEGVQ